MPLQCSQLCQWRRWFMLEFDTICCCWAWACIWTDRYLATMVNSGDVVRRRWRRFTKGHAISVLPSEWRIIGFCQETVSIFLSEYVRMVEAQLILGYHWCLSDYMASYVRSRSDSCYNSDVIDENRDSYCVGLFSFPDQKHFIMNKWKKKPKT
jgi:hypothetical protein